MATDVWSFSMTVIEVCIFVIYSLFKLTVNRLQILTESMPFSDIKRDANVIRYIMSGGRPRRETCLQIDDSVWAMLERCWDVAPDRRPSMVTLSQFFASRVAAGRR